MHSATLHSRVDQPPLMLTVMRISSGRRPDENRPSGASCFASSTGSDFWGAVPAILIPDSTLTGLEGIQA